MPQHLEESHQAPENIFRSRPFKECGRWLIGPTVSPYTDQANLTTAATESLVLVFNDPQQIKPAVLLVHLDEEIFLRKTSLEIERAFLIRGPKKTVVRLFQLPDVRSRLLEQPFPSISRRAVGSQSGSPYPCPKTLSQSTQDPCR